MSEIQGVQQHRHAEASRAVVNRITWSPAQILAGVFGLFFVVMGGVALARLFAQGGDGSGETTVWIFTQTLTLAIIELVVGVFYLAAAASHWSRRGLMATLGLATFAFGLVVVIEPTAFEGAFGDASATGMLFLVTGALAALAAWLSPTIFAGSTVTHDREVDVDRVDAVVSP